MNRVKRILNLWKDPVISWWLWGFVLFAGLGRYFLATSRFGLAAFCLVFALWSFLATVARVRYGKEDLRSMRRVLKERRRKR